MRKCHHKGKQNLEREKNRFLDLFEYLDPARCLKLGSVLGLSIYSYKAKVSSSCLSQLSWILFFSTRVLINIYIRAKKAGCKTACNNKIQIFILKTHFLLCMFRKYTGSTRSQIVNDYFGVAGKLVVGIFSFLLLYFPMSL